MTTILATHYAWKKESKKTVCSCQTNIQYKLMLCLPYLEPQKLLYNHTSLTLLSNKVNITIIYLV